MRLPIPRALQKLKALSRRHCDSFIIHICSCSRLSGLNTGSLRQQLSAIYTQNDSVYNGISSIPSRALPLIAIPASSCPLYSASVIASDFSSSMLNPTCGNFFVYVFMNFGRIYGAIVGPTETRSGQCFQFLQSARNRQTHI